MKKIVLYKKNDTNFNLKRLLKLFTLSTFTLLTMGCSTSKKMVRLGKPIDTRWDFNNLKRWVDGSQNKDNAINYRINNSVLNIFTRPNTWDRQKVKTKKAYKQGTYSWRVFVPEMGVGDMSSIGAFLYSDDTHELDFEIGYGTSIARQNLNASADEVIVYMTSQANPFQSIPHKISSNRWYTLEIELLIVNYKYQVVWYIDDTELVRLNLEYGESIPFYIFCSLENLTFLGDHIPSQYNYALFDYVEFTN